MSSNRRLAAIMFTDLVGYSALVQDNEAQAMMLLERHNSILRPLFEQHDGHEIKSTGDGFLVEFKSSLQAVRCAIAMQSALHGHNMGRKPEQQIQIRIGVHLGDVQEREDDIFGDGVNIAARIEPLASAGGICISNAVYELIRNKVDVRLESLGPHSLKNIEEPVEIYRVVLPWAEKDEEKIKPQPTLSRKVPLAVVAVAVVVAAISTWWAVSNSSSNEPAFLAPGEITSIAVLPFQNVSSDEENEYFSDGMSEELLNVLSSVDGLRVPGRTSSFYFKGKDVTIPEIGQLLGVQAVLEGSVRKEGDQVRITVQLTRTEDDTRLWSESYERKLENVFRTQEEIANSILEKIQLQFKGGNENISINPTDDLEAYNLYLQGIYHRNRPSSNDNGLAKGIDYLEQAVAKDPNFAVAQAQLAGAYIDQEVVWNGMSPKESYSKAIVANEIALKLDPSLATAHTVDALIQQHYIHDVQAAEAAFRKAIQLSPDDPYVHLKYANFLWRQQRIDESVAHTITALELEPVSYLLKFWAAYIFNVAGKYDLAEEQIEKMREIDPNNPLILWRIQELKWGQGDWEGLANELTNWLGQNPDEPIVLCIYFDLLTEFGTTSYAGNLLDEILNLDPPSAFMVSCAAESAYYRGDFEQAIELQEKAIMLAQAASGGLGSRFALLAEMYWANGMWEEGVAADLQAWPELMRVLEPIDIDEYWDAFKQEGLDGYLSKVMLYGMEKFKDRCWGNAPGAGTAAKRYAYLKEWDYAMECLEKTQRTTPDVRAKWYVRLPVFDEFRADPRFQAFIEKLGSKTESR